MARCYLCNSKKLSKRKGQVRDAPSIKILECEECGLVSLAENAHGKYGFYENSGMHANQSISIEEWLREAHWDDERRYEQFKKYLPNKRILDFGCGAGGFLSCAKKLAANAVGIELERRVQEYWNGSDIKIFPTIDAAADSSGGGYDLITAFHVLEHLSDPSLILKQLALLLQADGRIIIEVPSADDVLLTLYDCEAFQLFTYWSQHLFLFTSSTLATMIKKAGLKVISIQHYQRYPLANHLYWLSQGKPGGHKKWTFLDNTDINQAYAQSLATVGRTDTLIAHIERD